MDSSIFKLQEKIDNLEKRIDALEHCILDVNNQVTKLSRYEIL